MKTILPTGLASVFLCVLIGCQKTNSVSKTWTYAAPRDQYQIDFPTEWSMSAPGPNGAKQFTRSFPSMLVVIQPPQSEEVESFQATVDALAQEKGKEVLKTDNGVTAAGGSYFFIMIRDQDFQSQRPKLVGVAVIQLKAQNQTLTLLFEAPFESTSKSVQDSDMDMFEQTARSIIRSAK